MKKHLKKIFSLGLALAMIFSLVACGTGSSTADPGGNPQGTAPSASSDPSTGGDSAAPVKDILNVGYIQEQYTTPWRSTSGSAVSLCNLYDTLFTYDDDMNVVNQMAESYEVSEDGTVYTVKLKEGLLFHNGEEVTAEDVAWSLEYNWENGDSGKALLGTFDHAEVIDNYTVAIYLSAPFAPFLRCLCTRAAYICDKSHFDAIGGTIDAYEADPVGSGAYKFVSREPGATFTMEAFEDYFDGVPPIKTVVLHYISDANTQMISLESGAIDVMLRCPLTSVVRMDNPNLDWMYDNSATRVNFGFNTSRPVISDLNLRKAMQCLINREDILIAANEGYGTIADICIPYGYGARPTDYETVPEDVEKAKEYLAASSYNGETLRLVCTSGTVDERVSSIFQAQCNALGINVEISAVDSATMGEIRDKSHDYDIIAGTSLSSLVDSDLMYSGYGRPVDADKLGEDADRLAELCMLGRTATTEEGRVEAYTELVNIVTEKVYEITVFYDVNAVAYNKQLKGVYVQMINLFDLSRFYW